MKAKLFAFVLALSLPLIGWTQETPATPVTPNSTPAPQAQSCCHRDMAMKDGKGCCHHAAADSKDAAACCGKNKCEAKDGKSCCEGKDMKTAMKQCEKNGCCKDGQCCGEAKGDKAAMDCCGGNKCERHPQTQTGN
jgi:hypothetical protein